MSEKVGIFTLVVDSSGKFNFTTTIPLGQVLVIVERLLLSQAKEEKKEGKGEQLQGKPTNSTHQ